MDVLDDILDTLDLRGTLYFRTDFSAPWSVTVPKYQQAARFHLVIQGQCHVGFEDGESTILNPGDLILIPRGNLHILSDSPCQKAPDLETVLNALNYDGKGVLVAGDGDPDAATQMICGHFTFRQGADHPILRALPDYLITRAGDRALEPELDDILRLTTRRMFGGAPGSSAAVTRLSEIMFIELIRFGLARNEKLSSVMAAFSDKHIGNALSLIHERPEEAWTVQRLALEVGMSRSRFADRFGELVGTGPMSYLTDWRLQKALSALSEAGHSVQQIALESGYQSSAAFTRAFTTKFGIPPTEYRRNTQ
ncbi:MAG: AraC family transcriptional regulator [Sneathiellales bacterium]|nr:AraC family transcriptional regulator [Sneathiellales bacterium]